MTIQIPTLDFLAILPQLILVGMALLILLAEVTLLRHAKSGLGWLALRAQLPAQSNTARNRCSATSSASRLRSI